MSVMSVSTLNNLGRLPWIRPNTKIGSTDVNINMMNPGDMRVRRRNMASALFKAVLDCCFSRVKFMLNNGVEANVINDSGQNLLMTSLYIPNAEKRDKMFQYLLRRGVSVYQIERKTGKDVLMCASILGRVLQVRRILETTLGDIDLTRSDIDGMTALHHATKAGHVEVVRTLVSIMDKYRISVDISDKSGLTPYIYAKRLGYFGIGEILLREGHCSPRQFDNSTFQSVDDWIAIGRRERQNLAKQERVKQMNKYKIFGKQFPKVSYQNNGSHRLQLPQITVSESGHDDSTDSGIIMDHGSETSLDTKDSSKLYPDELQKNGKFLLPRITDASSQRNEYQGRGEFTNQGNRPVGTAFALLDLKAQRSDEMYHASHFFGSQRDTSKGEFGGLTGDISSLMDVLSAQQTDAFRVVAKAPTPPPKPASPVVTKKKVSTLAILFGKNNSKRTKPGYKGTRSRKSQMGMARNAKNSNSSKVPNRKKTGKG